MSTPIYTNREVAKALRDVAALMKLKGENRFRIAAMDKAAAHIAELEFGVADAVAQDRLERIESVGKGIAHEIRTLFAHGQMEAYTALSQEIPGGLIEVMYLPGIGPRKAVALWQELGIATLNDLYDVARQAKVRTLKGFTARSEAMILAAIDERRQRADVGEAIGFILPATEKFLALLRSATEERLVPRMVLTGELRQWKDTIATARILVQATDVRAVMRIAGELPNVARVSAQPGSAWQVTLHAGFDIELLFTTADAWWPDLVRTTGDQYFWSALLDQGQAHGYEPGPTGWQSVQSHDAAGAETRQGDEPITSEADFLARVGIPYLAPEQRTALGTPSLQESRPAEALIKASDLRGELHAHTTYSDGKNSLEEMARAAIRRGYAYWGVTDHGLGHGFGDSLDGALLAQQAAEIEALNHRFAQEGLDFRLLKGVEAEIRSDGSLGLDDEVLSLLDVVVASIHSSLRQDAATITRRCLDAIHNPHVDILGHPTSRLLGTRPPSALDVPRILQACQETGTAVEINCNPARLDLNDRYARMAADAGCMLVLNCDAHAVSDLEVMRYGMGVARRAGLEPANVLNTRPLPAVLTFCGVASPGH